MVMEIFDYMFVVFLIILVNAMNMRIVWSLTNSIVIQ